MPQFTFRRQLAANELGFNPLERWQYEFVPIMWGRGAAVSLLARTVATGVVVTVYSGGQTIQQRSSVPAGGVIGVVPSDFDVRATTWIAAPNDRLILQFDNTTAAVAELDGVITVEPM